MTTITAAKNLADLARDTVVSFTHPTSGEYITGEFSQVSTVHIGGEPRIRLELIVKDFCVYFLPLGQPITVKA